MRESAIPSVLGLLVANGLAAAVGAPPATTGRIARIQVPFVENAGQLPVDVAFSAETLFGTVAVTRGGRLAYTLRATPSAATTLAESFAGGRTCPTAGPPAATRLSAFRGADPKSWRSGLPTFEEVRLGEVWPGVSVALRAHARTVEKVFTLAPRASARRIRIRVDGANSLRVEPDGALAVGTAGGQIHFAAPLAYQEHGGARRPVPVSYALRGRTYGFRLGRFDPASPVIIDPVLQATYLGGADADSIAAMAIDPSTGDVLVAGSTYSANFPGTSGGAQGGKAVPLSGFVARFDATLETLRQATLLGGSASDEIVGLAVHPANGDVYVTGFTSSSDLPGALEGAEPTYAGGGDGFVARFDASLTKLLGATYLGGANIDRTTGIAVHPSTGKIYVVGNTSSTDFPGTMGGAAADPNDTFIARLDPELAHIEQATYFGSGAPDIIHALTIHPRSGEVLIGGQTLGGDLPATDGGANPGQPGNGNWDAFVARIDPALTRFLQTTYLGGSGGDDVRAIDVDPKNGDILVAGWTNWTDFPASQNGAQPASVGPGDGFVVRFNAPLTTLLAATYVGGSGDDYAWALAIDPGTGDVFVTGETFSTDLPGTAGGTQPEAAGRDEAFVARLDPMLSRWIQVTYLGGSGDDTSIAVSVNPGTGEVLVAGSTSSIDLPGTLGAVQPRYAGGSEFFGGDGWIARLTPSLNEAGSPCETVSQDPCLNGRAPVSLSVPQHAPRTATRLPGGGGSVSSLPQE